jgi:predicted RNA binding protein with dsRBD fold (UPF0201 family)
MSAQEFGQTIDIVVEAQVKKSESKDKVAGAISKLFPSGGELKYEADRVLFISSKESSLQFLRDQLRDRRIRAAARRLLLSNTEGSFQTMLLLNKQAATVGIAALCDDPDESPLGPIVLQIRSHDLSRVIGWLTKGYETSETS